MEDSNVKISYETLWKFIIRPPRDEYTESMLGSRYFKYKGKKYQRKDYDIMSTQGYMMKCSFIEPFQESRPSIEMPVVLYLHGNSSSRIEGLNMAGELLKRDINLFVIDFVGCGLSEGEYISLGYHESDDVGNVIDFIEKLPGVGRIGLWGRSMGAATTMIYAHRDNRVKAICLDSPFADFNRLARELTLKQINLPKFLINGALSIIRGTIINKNGLDIDKLKPIDLAGKTFQPAIFIHAIYDELINVQHSLDLFNKYGGQQKSLKCCDKGGHNTKRNSIIINEIGEFFKKYLSNEYKEENDNNNEYSSISDYTNYTENSNNSSNYNTGEVKKNILRKRKASNNKINQKPKRKNTIEEDEDPFNDNSIEKIEYLNKKEQTNRRQINEIEYLLKSIREPDLKAFGNKNNNNLKLDNNNFQKNKNNNNINNNFYNEFKNNNNNNNGNINNLKINDSNINFNNWLKGSKINSNNNY